MKAHYYLLALAALSFAACNPTTPEVPEVKPNLTVSGAKDNTISATADAKTVTLTVKANVSWAVTCDADWLTVDPQSAENADKKDVTTKVSVVIAANEVEEARTATLSVKAEGVEDVVITVNQEAKKAVAPVEKFLYVSDLELNRVETPAIALVYSGDEQTLNIYANVSWTATTEAEWLTVSPSSKENVDNEEDLTTVHVSADLNTTGSERTTEIVLSAEGVDDVTISVSQEPQPGYTFDITVSGITSSLAVVNVTPSADDVYYYVGLESAEYVNQFATGAELAAADLDYLFDKYGQVYSLYGYDSYEDFFVDNFCGLGSYSFNYKNLNELTNYVAYVFAVDGGLNVVSEVYKAEFTTEKSNATPEYSQWIGRWVVTGNENTVQNTINISEKVENETYVISGLQGFSDEVDGVINEDGSFSIVTTDLEDFTHETYGPIDMWFLGTVEYLDNDGKTRTSTISGDYPICTAVLSGDSATFTGTQLTLTDNSVVVISGMEFIGKILEGTYKGYVLSFNGDTPSIPATMERVVASSQASVSVRRNAEINLSEVSRSYSNVYPVQYSVKF